MSPQPDNAYKWVKKGIKHYKAKRYYECLEACERAIQLDPNCAKAYHGKALALAKQKRYEEALTASQIASHLAPENAKIHAYLAELLYRMGEYEESRLSYNRAVALDNRFEALYIKKSQMLLDDAFNLPVPYLCPSYMPEWFLNAFSDVLLFDPDNTVALAEIEKMQKRKRLALLVQYGSYNEAMETYLEALQLKPEDPILHTELAELWFHKGDYEESRISYKRAIQLNSRFEILYIKKSQMLLDKAFKLQASCLNIPRMSDSVICAFRDVLLFNPEDTIAPAEIEKMEKEAESLRNCPICYKSTLIYSGTQTNTANINLRTDQSDEEVRLYLLEGVKNVYPQPMKELTYRYFSRTAEVCEISIAFPWATYFRIEVLRNEAVLAFGLYWIHNGQFGQYGEYNIELTIIYEAVGRPSEEKTYNSSPSEENSYPAYWSPLKESCRNSVIYAPSRKRHRRARRGS